LALLRAARRCDAFQDGKARSDPRDPGDGEFHRRTGSVHHERRAVLGAGHFLHLEQPKTVADHILGFLNS
jgi:pimeloyl-ACP methyl ester carboxylesterase